MNISTKIRIKNDHFNFGIKEISVIATPRDDYRLSIKNNFRYASTCSELVIEAYFTKYFNNKEFAEKKCAVIFDPLRNTGGFGSHQLSFCKSLADCPADFFVAMTIVTEIDGDIIFNISYPENLHEYYYIKFAKV